MFNRPLARSTSRLISSISSMQRSFSDTAKTIEGLNAQIVNTRQLCEPVWEKNAEEIKKLAEEIKKFQFKISQFQAESKAKQSELIDKESQLNYFREKKWEEIVAQLKAGVFDWSAAHAEAMVMDSGIAISYPRYMFRFYKIIGQYANNTEAQSYIDSVSTKITDEDKKTMLEAAIDSENVMAIRFLAKICPFTSVSAHRFNNDDPKVDKLYELFGKCADLPNVQAKLNFLATHNGMSDRDKEIVLMAAIDSENVKAVRFLAKICPFTLGPAVKLNSDEGRYYHFNALLGKCADLPEVQAWLNSFDSINKNIIEEMLVGAALAQNMEAIKFIIQKASSDSVVSAFGRYVQKTGTDNLPNSQILSSLFEVGQSSELHNGLMVAHLLNKLSYLDESNKLKTTLFSNSTKASAVTQVYLDILFKALDKKFYLDDSYFVVKSARESWKWFVAKYPGQWENPKLVLRPLSRF